MHARAAEDCFLLVEEEEATFAVVSRRDTSRGRSQAFPRQERLEREAMAARVRLEFSHTWEGYKRYAWGHDELKPLSRAAHDWYGQSLLITPVDTLDTLLILGEKEEAESTRAYILGKLSFNKDISVKNFEITIRVLGGLMSASQMMRDPRLLGLAEDLGRRLLPVFDSPTGMP